MLDHVYDPRTRSLYARLDARDLRMLVRMVEARGVMSAARALQVPGHRISRAARGLRLTRQHRDVLSGALAMLHRARRGGAAA